MTCQFEHHAKRGAELGNCPDHPDEELRCGPFHCKVCVKCEPFLGQPCGICGTKRFACCC